MTKALISDAIKLSGFDKNGNNIAPKGHISIAWPSSISYFFPKSLPSYYPARLPTGRADAAGNIPNYDDLGLAAGLVSEEIAVAIKAFRSIANVADISFIPATSAATSVT